MKKYVFTAGLIAACATSISANGFAGEPYDPWTGCYIGGNTGRASFDVHTIQPGNGADGNLGSSNGNGWSYGGQAGCDVRFQSFVFGIRGMWDGSNASADKTLVNFNIGNFPQEQQHTRLKEFKTLDAKIGFLSGPSFMIYGVGGWAWSDLHTSFNESPGQYWTADGSWTGYNVGIGGSWLFAPNWELWVEYDHLRFGERGLNVKFLGNGNSDFVTQKPSVDAVLVGVNYRFNFAH